MWCVIIWFFTCLIFWSHSLIKQMIGSRHSQLCKKSSCSVKLQDGLSDHNPRRIPAHDFTFNLYKVFYLVNRTENYSNFVKKINDFGYALPNSCFTEQFSMPASEYTNKCNKRYFSVCQKWKYTKWTRKNQKKENLKKK